jgi:hypothetical protein
MPGWEITSGSFMKSSIAVAAVAKSILVRDTESMVVENSWSGKSS